jgi:hypothetical protein
MSAVVVVLLGPWLLVAALFTGVRLYYRLGGGRSLARHRRSDTARHMFAVDAPSGQLMRAAVDAMDRTHVRVVATERHRVAGVSRVSSVFRGQLLTLWLMSAGGVTMVEVECTPAPRRALIGQRDARRFAESVVARLEGEVTARGQTSALRPQA